MNDALEATFYRTALLLGIVRGEAVHRWAARAIEREPNPPRPFVDVVSVPASHLSELRHALWPMVVDPEPEAVLAAIFRVLHKDLVSGARGLTDTIAILRQMRSMLRLPPALYTDLNAALVSQGEARSPARLALWLEQRAAGAIVSEQEDA